MPNPTHLIVYNICEIGHRNCDWYVNCVDNLLKLDHSRYHVVISGCRVSQETKDRLHEKYKGTVSLSFTENFIPVNMTFNLAVQQCVKRFGSFDGYLYIDSGVDVQGNRDLLNQMEERFVTDRYSMVTAQTDTDHGHHWFNEDHVHNPYIKGEDFVMPVGKCCNLHVQLFSNDLLNAYGRLIPDIFVAYCTESVFSFLNAGIQKQWVIIKDVILTHIKEKDGATQSYDHAGPRKEHWNNLYGMSDMSDIINDPLAKEVGLGYEELNGVLLHDPALYDENGHCNNMDLKKYIKDKLFLQPDQLQYDHILSHFIPAK